MTAKRITHAIAFAVAALALAGLLEVALAQPAPARSEAWARVEQRIVERERRADTLHGQGRRNLVLTLLVIAAGALASGLQLLKHDSAKVVTGICGIAASALTSVNAAMYPIGWKDVVERVTRARASISDARDYIALHPDLPDNSDDRSVYESEVWKFLKRADGALNGLSAATTEIARVESGAPSLFVATAFADVSPNAPAWISKTPTDPDGIFVVGEGRSDNASDARTDALRLARQELERTMLDAIASDPGGSGAEATSLADQLGKAAGVVDTYFETSELNDRRLYVYYVLLRLDRSDLEDTVARAQVRAGKAIESRGVEAVIDQKEDDPYYARRWQAYASALDVARTTLTPHEYELLIQGRNARRDQRWADAVTLLEPAVKPALGWYLGWYNLALSYPKLGNVDAAVRAYDAAASLEVSLEVHDPSLYNSYGHLLYEQKRYREAVVQLDKALAIDPAMTGARYTKQQAERGLQVATAQ